MAAGEKRDVVLRAALELFAEKGFHGAPISQIADQAGVGVGTIYRYFKDKDELVRELHSELHQRAQEQICGDFSEGLPLRQRYLRMMTKALSFFLENPREFRFIELYYFSPYSREDDFESPENLDPVKQLLYLGRSEQIIKDAPMVVLKALAFGPIVSLAKENQARGLPITEEMIAKVVEASWDGLKR